MIKGYSTLSRKDKISHLTISKESEHLLNKALVSSPEIADVIDELSENTIAHFPFPFGIVPNVVVNKKTYNIPLVTEESSVVAAIAKSVKFWAQNGGFKTKVIGTEKKGQVHFFWKGDAHLLETKFDDINDFLLLRLGALTRNMKKRGGGINNISLLNKTNKLENYYQLDVSFETAEAMGANFINTCLEEMGKSLKQFVSCDQSMDANLLEVNMAILSNYTPNSKVMAKASCPINSINDYGQQINVSNLSSKLVQAFQIAKIDKNRAVTHNKGIYNGIDALLLATGNDWRAVEACGHAYASKEGQYSSISRAFIKDNEFHIELELPFAIGTIGGVTQLHPIAKIAMEIMHNPNAKELMQLIAVSGLAANFSAVLALTTSGIQKGHMKMHLSNLLKQLKATNTQKELAKSYFKDKTVSHSELNQWLKNN